MKWIRRAWRWVGFRWRLWREPDPLTKAKMRLGWAMSVPMGEVCQSMAEWVRENREWMESESDEE